MLSLTNTLIKSTAQMAMQNTFACPCLDSLLDFTALWYLLMLFSIPLWSISQPNLADWSNELLSE